ncbi:hypothetical protein HBI78_242140 [Parastagonospora nodorum]|nr:hypothetical protein HBI78_242140 [Parastagonospora nodorum]
MLKIYSDSDFKRRLDRVINVARDSQWQIGTARDSAAPLWTNEALGSHTTSTQYYGQRETVLHRPRLTKTTTTTPHPNNIKLKAALTLTLDNYRTNRLLYSLIHTSSTKLN